MSILNVILLAIVQGLAELLPVSSSAHVIVAEKLLHIDPTSPQATLLLVMLHTGTMFAVILYFWKTWKQTYFSTARAFKQFAILVLWATLLSLLFGEAVIKLIEKTLFHNAPKAELESLFGRLDLIAPALAAAGLLILIAGLYERRHRANRIPGAAINRYLGLETVSFAQSTWMGFTQGLALPFRGFSRSGSTISVGMLVGASKQTAERFSFAMAVVITPLVIGVEVQRLLKASHAAKLAGAPIDLHGAMLSSLLGMVFSFFAGLVALKWLSSWLESGRWYLFGIYCLIASAAVYYLYTQGL